MVTWPHAYGDPVRAYEHVIILIQLHLLALFQTPMLVTPMKTHPPGSPRWTLLPCHRRSLTTATVSQMTETVPSRQAWTEPQPLSHRRHLIMATLGNHSKPLMLLLSETPYALGTGGQPAQVETMTAAGILTPGAVAMAVVAAVAVHHASLDSARLETLDAAFWTTDTVTGIASYEVRMRTLTLQKFTAQVTSQIQNHCKKYKYEKCRVTWGNITWEMGLQTIAYVLHQLWHGSIV